MQAQLGTTRRTVIKGAAWSAPVIVTAAAAPAASASTAPELVLDFSGLSGTYVEQSPGVTTIDTTGTVTPVSGTWPAGGVRLLYTFRSPVDGIASGEGKAFTPVGQDSVSFSSSVGAGPGFTQYSLTVYEGTSTRVLGASGWQTLGQLP